MGPTVVVAVTLFIVNPKWESRKAWFMQQCQFQMIMAAWGPHLNTLADQLVEYEYQLMGRVTPPGNHGSAMSQFVMKAVMSGMWNRCGQRRVLPKMCKDG